MNDIALAVDVDRGFPDKKGLAFMDEKYAKDIKCCEECPLHETDCSDGVTGTPNGYIEPPCCSWNDDTLVYEGMYAE